MPCCSLFTAVCFDMCVCRHLDYIKVPCSQEDDAHNVQSVIDSLSLDYLQISLSHITGAVPLRKLSAVVVCERIVSLEYKLLRQPELHITVALAGTPAMTPLSVCASAGENVVRGHRESVKNLLEIFEGLLEYLMEEMSEESQNGGWHKLKAGA